MRFIIGGVFIWASHDKIIDPSKFAREISNYHVMPFGLENTVAIILPWLELFIGIGIIAGIYINANALLSGSLLILFNILVFQAMVRGFNIECGCGLKEGQWLDMENYLKTFHFCLGVFLYLKPKSIFYILKIELKSF